MKRVETKHVVLICLLLWCIVGHVFAQTPRIDSLQKALSKHQVNDTVKVNLLIDLGIELSYFANKLHIDSVCCYRALQISKQLHYQHGIFQSYIEIARYKSNSSHFDSVLYYLNLATIVNKRIKSQLNESEINFTIGTYYLTKSNYSNAYSYFMRCLVLDQKLERKRELARDYSYIGLVQFNTKFYSKAMKSFDASMTIYEELKDWDDLLEVLYNYSMVYNMQKDYSKAKYVLEKALKLESKFKNEKLKGKILNELGALSLYLENYAEAAVYFQECMRIAVNIKSEFDICIYSNNLGYIYLKLGEFDKAIYYLKRAEINSKNRFPSLYIETQSSLSELYEAIHQPDKALSYYKHYIEIRDSMNSETSIKKMTEVEMQFAQEKKDAIKQLEQEKKDARQRTIRNSILLILFLLTVFLIVVFRQRNLVRKEKHRSDSLLLNILPLTVAEELKQHGATKARYYEQVSVLFTDFKGFTALSEQLSTEELIVEIDTCFKAFDRIMQQHGIEKIKTIGDAYMAAAGIPEPNAKHALHIVNAAIDLRDYMQHYKQEREAAGKLFFELRIGIHSGAVVAGVVGLNKFAYDIWGDTVNTASRMESAGEVGKINISESTYQLVKNDFACSSRGKISAKGKGELDMYFAERKT